jgi:hypothetical protein
MILHRPRLRIPEIFSLLLLRWGRYFNGFLKSPSAALRHSFVVAAPLDGCFTLQVLHELHRVYKKSEQLYNIHK